MLLAWFTLQVALVLAAVHAMARAPWRRALSFACLTAALALPFVLPTGPLPRALLSALSLLALVKVLRVEADPDRWPASRRTWHALAPFDVDLATRVPPLLDRRLLAWTALHAASAIAALMALHLLPRMLPLWMQALRLLLGIAMVYAGMEAMTGALRLGHRLAGIDVPPLQDRPLAAQSIREFWNRRWNRPVSGWLDDYVFAPIAARRGATVALLAAFAASGLLHAWVFLSAVGWIAAISAGLFFAFQAFFILVESFVGIRRASTGLRRLWTLGLLGLSAPLFVDPVLRGFEL
jgi:hypothetical protein